VIRLRESGENIDGLAMLLSDMDIPQLWQ
jgi:hypothetical protein